MSSQKGNVAKTKAPKYQNAFAFRHNKKSLKTKKILSTPNEGLCAKCTEKIEWRKKYRKYKPLTTWKKCTHCQKKSINMAYHILCAECSKKLNVCAKCTEKKEIVSKIQTKEDKLAKESALREMLRSMPERERRTYYRKLERGEISESDFQVSDDEDDLMGSGYENPSSGEKPDFKDVDRDEEEDDSDDNVGEEDIDNAN